MSSKVDVVKTLKAARKLLSGRGAWMRHWFAADKEGAHVASRDPAACKWCSLGALNSVAMPNQELCDSAAEAIEAVVGTNLITFNDRATSKRQVLAAFDAAISKAEATNVR